MPELKPRVTAPRQPAPVVPIDAGGHRERVLARRDELVEDHLELVTAIARTLLASLPPSFDLDDLIGAGNVALVNAATRYRPHMHGGAPFSAYARQVIRGAMLDSVRNKQYRENTRPPLEDAEELPAPGTPIEISIDRGRLWRHVTAAIAQLPAPQRAVLEAYYGPDEPTMADVAGSMRLTQGRASQVHNEALNRLRVMLRAAAV